jgi:glucokinase
MGKYCFGIDVGGTTVKCGLFQTDGTLLEKWEIPTRTEEKGEYILADVAQTINEKIAEKQLDKNEIDGVGIGIPGPINENGETPFAVNLYWGFKPVAKELSELTGLPAKAGNDANVAALGEAWKGAAEGAKNVVMITLGTGVGGGIIINGKILNGFHGGGGEVGHACVDHQETEYCNCGNKGCLEQFASATGIVRLGKKELESSTEDSVLRGIEKLTAKDILDAYKNDDAVAVRVMEKVGDYLGGALAIFSCVVDPQTIVVGGGVSKAGQPLIDCIQKYYNKYAFSLCKDTSIVLASLGNDAGIYGAACMVLEKA